MWKKVKMWAILRKKVVILLYVGEVECKTRVDTTRMESNTLNWDEVSDKLIKFFTNTTKHPGSTQP